MTDLVSQLVGALERLSGQCERMRLPGQRMSDAEKNAIAALTAAKAGGWMPIETAPVGADVLLLSTLRRVHVFVGDWGDFNKHNHPRITHWQPLPNPPKEQA